MAVTRIRRTWWKRRVLLRAGDDKVDGQFQNLCNETTGASRLSPEWDAARAKLRDADLGDLRDEHLVL